MCFALNKKTRKEMREAVCQCFSNYPPALNFLDLGAGQLECGLTRMKRANHNIEDRFCQNLEERPTPYSIVKRSSSAFWLTFPFQAQALEPIPNMAGAVRENLTFTSLACAIGNDCPQLEPGLQQRLP